MKSENVVVAFVQEGVKLQKWMAKMIHSSVAKWIHNCAVLLSCHTIFL